MQIVTQKIAPCLWYDTEAEEAAKLYVSIFKNSKINAIARYPDEGQEIHGKEAGSVMTVAFQLAGQSFVALNGGPHFKFDEAVSFHRQSERRRLLRHDRHRLLKLLSQRLDAETVVAGRQLAAHSLVSPDATTFPEESSTS